MTSNFIKPIFSTGISVFENPNINNTEILKTILELKEKTTGVTLSNVGGWQSHDIDKDTLTPPFQELVQWVSSCAGIYLDCIGIKKGVGVSGNMWYNVNGYKDFNMQHTHPQSIVSAVYYVKVPKNIPGNIVFINDNKIIDYTAPYMFDKEKMNEYSANIYEIEPTENTLILFPSWIPHLVKPCMSDDIRVSIALNMTPVGYDILSKEELYKNNE